VVRKTDKFADLPEEDREAVELFRSLARDLGRAISLSCVAATCNRARPHATLKAAEAWTELADRIIEFAMED
jgi:hypothetical protein